MLIQLSINPSRLGIVYMVFYRKIIYSQNSATTQLHFSLQDILRAIKNYIIS